MDNIRPGLKELMDSKNRFIPIIGFQEDDPKKAENDFNKAKDIFLVQAEKAVSEAKLESKRQVTPEEENKAVMAVFDLNFTRFVKERLEDMYGKASEGVKIEYAKAASKAGAAMYQLKTGEAPAANALDVVTSAIYEDEQKSESLSKEDAAKVKELSGDPSKLADYVLAKIHSANGRVSESLLDGFSAEIGKGVVDHMPNASKMSANEYGSKKSIAIHDAESELSINKYTDMVASVSQKPAAQATNSVDNVSDVKFANRTAEIREKGVSISHGQPKAQPSDAVDVLLNL